MIPKIITNAMMCTLDAQIKRARARFEFDLKERRVGVYTFGTGDERYEKALTSRIHWHHQWLKYGESLAETVRLYDFQDYDADYRDGKFNHQQRSKV